MTDEAKLATAAKLIEGLAELVGVEGVAKVALDLVAGVIARDELDRMVDEAYAATRAGVDAEARAKLGRKA